MLFLSEFVGNGSRGDREEEEAKGCGGSEDAGEEFEEKEEEEEEPVLENGVCGRNAAAPNVRTDEAVAAAAAEEEEDDDGADVDPNCDRTDAESFLALSITMLILSISRRCRASSSI